MARLTTNFAFELSLNRYDLVPTSDDENVIVTLPTNNPALGPVEYPHTTRYHWPNFDLNATDPNSEDFEVVSGPNLFREAVELKQGHDKVNF